MTASALKHGVLDARVAVSLAARSAGLVFAFCGLTRILCRALDSAFLSSLLVLQAFRVSCVKAYAAKLSCENRAEMELR